MTTKKTSSRSSSVEDPATQYAREVHSGERVAGPDIRNACARHLKDLKEGHKRGLVWDLEEANKAIRFYRTVLKLNGGEFEGLPFELLPWQKFIVGSIFGWKTNDGYRRFRVVYVESGKGSGKSPLAAGVGLKGLVADNEARAEIYAAATKKRPGDDPVSRRCCHGAAVAGADEAPGLQWHRSEHLEPGLPEGWIVFPPDQLRRWSVRPQAAHGAD